MNIWINGCFDIIHSGHIQLFEYAKRVSNYRNLSSQILVGIDSDNRVKELKGENRPINSQDDRKKVLEAIGHINYVSIFDSEEELENLIKESKIDLMIVGEDYKNKRVIGSQYTKEILFFPIVEGKSTTSIIEKILKTYQQ